MRVADYVNVVLAMRKRVVLVCVNSHGTDRNCNAFQAHPYADKLVVATMDDVAKNRLLGLEFDEVAFDMTYSDFLEVNEAVRRAAINNLRRYVAKSGGRFFVESPLSKELLDSL